MGNTFVSTVDQGVVYNALLDDHDRLIEIHPYIEGMNSLVGNIYIGRVNNAIKGLNAVFVDIGLDQDVFLQMEKDQYFIYTNGKENNLLPKVGDDLLVQVTKDAYMTKAPAVTSMISIAGRYSVLTYKRNFVGLSNKINKPEERRRLKSIFEAALSTDYGFIIRTNAEGTDEADLTQERDILVSTFKNIMETGCYRSCFTRIYSQPEPFIKLIRDLYQDKIDKYLFDSPNHFEQARTYFNGSYYSGLSDLFVLNPKPENTYFTSFGLKAKMDKAILERVWLNSGANLIIQPTEALTVIDVNTSKSASKKTLEATAFAINMEATTEIGRQLRLRNISGIVIIDFIGMQEEEHVNDLLERMQRQFERDRVKTTVVDMTALGLVEITRKKTDKSLYEKIKEINIFLDTRQ